MVLKVYRTGVRNIHRTGDKENQERRTRFPGKRKEKIQENFAWAMGPAAINGKLATEFNERTTEMKFFLSSCRLILQSNGIFATTAKVFSERNCNKTKKPNIRGRNCVIRERIENSNDYHPPRKDGVQGHHFHYQ